MSATTTPTPLASVPPEFISAPAWRLPGWFEPVLVASILFGACFYTRRRYINLFGPSRAPYRPLFEQDDDADNLSAEALGRYSESDVDGIEAESEFVTTSSSKFPPKRRTICGLTIRTPNTARFAANWHSRVLYKFPFLMEMFYWVLTYFIYRLTHVLSQAVFADKIWDLAQENGLRVLEVEQFSMLRFLFPVQEITVQRWFMEYHPDFLTVLNKGYALVHIPGTVFFMAWYYSAAPTHALFATVRRTITLCNLAAFSVFMAYPCMPPRLLPAEYGFVDTVRRDSAESVWMSGRFVNHLAAMPSMHFGYAFMIGSTVVFHAVRHCVMGRPARVALAMLGVAYPTAVLTTIVATANHYWLDATAAACVAVFSLFCNRVFLVFMPLEDWLLFVLRVEKPRPNCGSRR